MKILLLTDGKAGHENQSRAFARALGGSFEIARVSFKSRAAKAASYVLDRLGVQTGALFEVDPPADASGGYSVVVGTGSGVFYAVKTLAKRLGAKCGVVLYPRGYSLSGFDCVLAPSFDRPAKAPNVVEIPANLVAGDEEFYAKGVEAFLAHRGATGTSNADSGKGATAVIVGGPNKCAAMTPEWMRARLDEIFGENQGREMWVTTSRRTPRDVEAVVDSYPWDYKLIYSKDTFNPVPAFVALAGRLYVTAESTGMLSEACTSGTAEVKALDNLLPGDNKYRRFVDALRRDGCIDGASKIDLSPQFAAAKRLMGL